MAIDKDKMMTKNGCTQCLCTQCATVKDRLMHAFCIIIYYRRSCQWNAQINVMAQRLLLFHMCLFVCMCVSSHFVLLFINRRPFHCLIDRGLRMRLQSNYSENIISWGICIVTACDGIRCLLKIMFAEWGMSMMHEIWRSWKTPINCNSNSSFFVILIGVTFAGSG